VRLVFVGQPAHARIWAGDAVILKRVLPQIKIIRLRPWSRSYLGSRIESIQLSVDLVDQARMATGGWSEVISPLIERIGEKPSEAKALVALEAKRLAGLPNILELLGVPPDLIGFYRDLAAYSEGSTITPSDFQYLCTSDGRNISPRVLSVYSDLLGIMSFPSDPTSAQGLRRVDLNPLVQAVLLSQTSGDNGTA
jgi:hypothetical protein